MSASRSDPDALLPSTVRALQHRVAAEQRDGRAPSLVAGVVREGRTVFRSSIGEADPDGGAAAGPDVQYRIGSITKTFIAVAVMQLRDEGALRLNDPISVYLDAPVLGEQTVAQLLSHTAGLTAEPPTPWWERSEGTEWPQLMELLDEETTPLRAGARFHYSNLGYGVLGKLVERLRGAPWQEVVAERILAPLELRRTTPMPRAPHAQGLAVHPFADVVLPEPAPDAAALAPAGQFWSTLEDQLRWLAFLGGDTAEVLHPDTVAEMRRPIAVDDGDAWLAGIGLGLQLRRDRGHRLAGHTGSMPGFLATTFIDPDTGTGAVAMANATGGPAVGAVVADLIDHLDTTEPVLPRAWRPLSRHDPDLLALTGAWFWGSQPYHLHLLAENWLDLRPQNGAGRASRFRPVSVDTWQGLDGYYAGEPLRVQRGADGSVRQLNLNTFIFTRQPYDPAADIPGGVDARGWRAIAE